MLKLLAVEYPDGVSLEERATIAVHHGFLFTAFPCDSEAKLREATPDDVRAAFIADAEARGAGESIRDSTARLHRHGGVVCEAEEERTTWVLQQLILSALLEPPALAVASVGEPVPDAGKGVVP